MKIKKGVHGSPYLRDIVIVHNTYLSPGLLGKKRVNGHAFFRLFRDNDSVFLIPPEVLMLGDINSEN